MMSTTDAFSVDVNQVRGVTLTKLVQTCWACPSQWDAWDADGAYYYIRFRHGFLSVDKNFQSNEVFSASNRELDSFLTESEMLEVTEMVLSADCEVSCEG